MKLGEDSISHPRENNAVVIFVCSRCMGKIKQNIFEIMV
jgi:hypothetical protein